MRSKSRARRQAASMRRIVFGSKTANRAMALILFCRPNHCQITWSISIIYTSWYAILSHSSRSWFDIPSFNRK